MLLSNNHMQVERFLIPTAIRNFLNRERVLLPTACTHILRACELESISSVDDRLTTKVYASEYISTFFDIIFRRIALVRTHFSCLSVMISISFIPITITPL